MHRFLRLAAGLLVTLILVAGATPATAQGDDGALEEGPGETIVDYAPAVDPTDPAVTASIQAMEASVALSSARSASLRAEAALVVDGVTLTFNADFPSPSEVQDVVVTAASDWAAELDVSGPVEVEVFWFPFGNQSVLGSAGFLAAYRGGGVLPDEYFTPGPLANVLLGTDIDPGAPEIQVVLNSDFGSRWYISTTGQPGGNQVDLYSVVLHELGHGFGFVGSASSSAGAPPALLDPPFGYDTHVYHGSDRLLDLLDPSSFLQSDNLFFDLPTGERYKLYDPTTWQQGSSYSHFDEATYTGADPGALMTPQLANAEVQRALDDPVIGVMDQIGWPLRSDPPPADSAVLGGTVTTIAGAPVADLVVDLFVANSRYSRGAWLGDARTSTSGAFAFESLAAGCYILTFIAPTGGTFPANGTRYLNRYACLADGEINTGVDAVVDLGDGPSSSIGGTVTVAGGGAFSGLVVDRFSTNADGSRALWLGDETTGADGTYSFASVAPGCYVLVFIAPDGYQMVGGNRYLEATVCIQSLGDDGVVDAQVTPGP